MRASGAPCSKRRISLNAPIAADAEYLHDAYMSNDFLNSIYSTTSFLADAWLAVYRRRGQDNLPGGRFSPLGKTFQVETVCGGAGRTSGNFPFAFLPGGAPR